MSDKRYTGIDGVERRDRDGRFGVKAKEYEGRGQGKEVL